MKITFFIFTVLLFIYIVAGLTIPVQDEGEVGPTTAVNVNDDVEDVEVTSSGPAVLKAEGEPSTESRQSVIAPVAVVEVVNDDPNQDQDEQVEGTTVESVVVVEKSSQQQQQQVQVQEDDVVEETAPTEPAVKLIEGEGLYYPDKEFVRPLEPTAGDDEPAPTTVNPIDPDFDFSQTNVTIEEIGSGIRIHTGRAQCKCGIPNRKIVGGEETSIHLYPWTVALVRGGWWGSGKAYCGGTLINNFYVVTASHCVDGMTASGISVVINQEDFKKPTSANMKYGVSKIIMHPNYDRRTINNDIALIKLEQPVKLGGSSVVTPACLPATDDNDFDGITATVLGWGVTTEGGTTSSRIRKVDVPVITNDRCNKDTKYNGKITENMLCAGDVEKGGKDACQGDSGGPLVIDNGNRKTLIGVVSWGYGCAKPKAPGVYSRVSKYPKWILQHTSDADWCQL